MIWKYLFKIGALIELLKQLIELVKNREEKIKSLKLQLKELGITVCDAEENNDVENVLKKAEKLLA